MKTSVNFCDFQDAFSRMNRGNNFTYEGLRALFDYLERYEEECDAEVELDVIALCCEYTEYSNIEEVKENYDGIETLEDLQDHTTVIEFETGLIIQNY